MRNIILLIALFIVSVHAFAAQPTNNPRKNAQVWDEQNSAFIIEEVSYLSHAGLNSGAGNVKSNILDLKKNTLAQFQIVQATGNITGAVATLQHSVDGITFVNTATTVTSGGVSAQVAVGRYVRIKFTTNSSGASTANVFIVGR